MRYYYKNKDSDFYNPKIYDNPLIWIVISLVVSISGYWAILRGYTLNGLLIDICTVSTITFVAVTTWQVIQVKKYLGSFRNLISYLTHYDWVEAINTAILNSRSSAGMINKSYRVLPKIWIWKYSSAPGYKIKIQKLAGTYESDLDKVAEMVSSAVGDNYRITSKSIAQDQSWFDLVISPVNRNLLFIPKEIADLQQPLYKVRLMNNLILDFSRLPHLACFGKTNSGKSTVLWSIVLQTIGNGELYFEDFKNEFSILSNFYPQDRFATDTDQIVKMLEKLVQIMNSRKRIIAQEAKRRGIIGLTGFDMKMKPIYFVADEWASVLAAFGTDTSERKKKKHCEDLMRQLLMQARSTALIILYVSQSPSTDVLSNQDRSQFGTYILLGSANSDVQRMALGEVATSGSIGNFTGYYMQSTAQMTSPQLFEVPDIYRHKLNTVKTYKCLYRKENKKC